MKQIKKWILLAWLILFAGYGALAQPRTENINGPSGTFGISQQEYGNNMEIRYNINVGSAGRVKISGDVTLEGEPYDYIEIYETDESLTEMNLSASFDFGHIEYSSLMNHGKLILIFVTDGSGCGNDASYLTGFSLNYSVNNNPISILESAYPAVIQSNTTEPNLTVSNIGYKSMYTSVNNQANFDNSTLLIKTGTENKLGFGEQTIASSSNLYLKSASSMYFNSNGNYYFNSPNTSSPTAKVDVKGSMAISGSSSANYSLDVGSSTGAGKGANIHIKVPNVQVADTKPGIRFDTETFVVDGTSEFNLINMYTTDASSISWQSRLAITSSPTWTGDGTSKTWLGLASKNK